MSGCRPKRRVARRPGSRAYDQEVVAHLRETGRRRGHPPLTARAQQRRRRSRPAPGGTGHGRAWRGASSAGGARRQADRRDRGSTPPRRAARARCLRNTAPSQGCAEGGGRLLVRNRSTGRHACSQRWRFPGTARQSSRSGGLRPGRRLGIVRQGATLTPSGPEVSSNTMRKLIFAITTCCRCDRAAAAASCPMSARVTPARPRRRWSTASATPSHSSPAGRR